MLRLLEQAELLQLRTLVMAEHRDSDLAVVLQVLQRQVHDLAAEFSAFKKVETQQLMDLKGAIGGTTQVFNVSYPPFIIPLVNVHESRESNDKTINISGNKPVLCPRLLSLTGERCFS